MPVFPIDVNGITFQVEGESRQAAAAALAAELDRDVTLFQRAAEKRGLSVEDVRALSGDQSAFAPESQGALSDFGIGVANTAIGAVEGLQDIVIDAQPPSPIRGAAQQQLTEQIQTREAQLSNVEAGVGAEDLGEIVTETLATQGRNLISSTGKAFALGASRATAEEESRVLQGLLESGASVAPALLANGVTVRLARRVGKAIGKGGRIRNSTVQRMVSNGADEVQVVDELSSALLDNVQQEVNTGARRILTDAVQSLNTRARETVVGEAVVKSFRNSLEAGADGSATVNYAKFNRGLAEFSDAFLRNKKQLGPAFGSRIAAIRNAFEELPNVVNLRPEEAEGVLNLLFESSQARSLARIMNQAKSQSAKEKVAASLLRRAVNGGFVSTVAQGSAALEPDDE